MKTLNERVLEAKMIARLGKIMSRDAKGRVKSVMLPGSEATMNRVILRRTFNGLLVECHKICGRMGHKDCLGNCSGVCRHAIAAIIAALEDMGYVAKFRRNEEQAKAVAHRNKDTALADDNGEPVVLTVRSTQGRKNALYLVAIDKTAEELIKHAQTMNLEERVNLMRGKKEEEVID